MEGKRPTKYKCQKSKYIGKGGGKKKKTIPEKSTSDAATEESAKLEKRRCKCFKAI